MSFEYKDINQHPLFLQLTDTQQKFTIKYIETKDMALSIAHAGYNCKNVKTAEMMARKNFRHPIIKQLLAEGLDYEPCGGILTKRESMLIASDGARKCKSNEDKVRYLQILAVLKGWTKQPKVIEDKVKAQIHRLELSRRRKA